MCVWLDVDGMLLLCASSAVDDIAGDEVAGDSAEFVVEAVVRARSVEMESGLVSGGGCPWTIAAANKAANARLDKRVCIKSILSIGIRKRETAVVPLAYAARSLVEEWQRLDDASCTSRSGTSARPRAPFINHRCEYILKDKISY